MDELIEITLDGQKYRVRADEEPRLVLEAAKLVNDHIDEVRKKAKASSPHQVSLLSALHLALRLRRVLQELDSLKTNTRSELKTLAESIENEIQSIQPLVSTTAGPPQ